MLATRIVTMKRRYAVWNEDTIVVATMLDDDSIEELKHDLFAKGYAMANGEPQTDEMVFRAELVAENTHIADLDIDSEVSWEVT